MWKRKRTWLLLFALIVAALAVYFEPTRRVRGWLHGEAFFDGRPTSWWRGVVIRDVDPPPRNWVDRVVCLFRKEEHPRLSRPLACEPDGIVVLSELTDDDDPRVAAFARHFSSSKHQSMTDFERHVNWEFYLLLLPRAFWRTVVDRNPAHGTIRA